MDKFTVINHRLLINKENFTDGRDAATDSSKTIYFKMGFGGLQRIWRDAKNEIVNPGELNVIKGYVRDDIKFGLTYKPADMDLSRYAELFKELDVKY